MDNKDFEMSLYFDCMSVLVTLSTLGLGDSSECSMFVLDTAATAWAAACSDVILCQPRFPFSSCKHETVTALLL